MLRWISESGFSTEVSIEMDSLAPIETALELRLMNNNTKPLGKGVGDGRNRSDGSLESKSRPNSIRKLTFESFIGL